MLTAALLSGIPIVFSQTPQRGVKDGTAQPASVVPLGPYYALVIGNNDYRYLPKLQTAVFDATEVAKLLQQRYGFAPPTVLLNASRNQILTVLNVYRRELPENANLLIYYAGHGIKDRDTQKAYWLPVNARTDSDVEWISASTITEEISALHSPHILVISDSCYSGELVRSAPVAINPSERTAYLKRMLESPSRTLMASGRDEPVADSGAAGHSKFAYVLLESLRRMDEDKFTAGDLFQRFIQPWVAGGSNQVPQYSVIQNSGHAYGDFVFSRGGNGVLVVHGLGGPGTGPDVSDNSDRPINIPTEIAPIVSPEADLSAIKDVLHQYEEAYNLKDANTLWKIWPSAPTTTRQAVEAAFNGAKSVRMTLQQAIPSIGSDGQSATVTGQFSEVYTPKGRSPQSFPNEDITFTFKKNNGVWTIVGVK